MGKCEFCRQETPQSVLDELGMCGSCQDFFDDPGSYVKTICPLCGNWGDADYIEENDVCHDCDAVTD